MSTWIWAWLAGAPLLPLSLTVFNLLTWPRRGRGSQPGRYDDRVSVLVPARNEEATIEACIRAIASSEHPVHEIVVCDDQSTDATPEILQRLGRQIPHLRVIRGRPLPDGWVGKPHACHQLASVATGDVLIFVDADTLLAPSAVERVLSFMHPPDGRRRASVVTAVPRQLTGTFIERLVMPLLVMTYTSWLPLLLVSASQDPRFVAANGQLLAVRRDAYHRLGGFAAVAHEIVDDVAFCRHAKERGERVVFADGTAMARCRMYASAKGLWEGFSKNIYEGIGGTPWALALVVALHLAFFVAPYVGVMLALGGMTELLWPSLVGVAANVALRGVLALRFDQPLEGLLLHPISVLTLCAIAFNSALWSARGRLTWAGRSYRGRSERLTVASTVPPPRATPMQGARS